MREILFRGKAINRNIDYRRTKYKNGDWVYGLLTRLYDERFVNLPAEMTNTDGVSGIEIDHHTVGQYTGLISKSGARIFEGDVVQVVYGTRRCGTYAVSMSKERGGWFPFACGDGCGCCECDVERAENCEIIGNIHDNPELLEKGDAE